MKRFNKKRIKKDKSEEKTVRIMHDIDTRENSDFVEALFKFIESGSDEDANKLASEIVNSPFTQDMLDAIDVIEGAA